MTSNNLIKKATRDGWISLDYLKEQSKKRKITFWLTNAEEKSHNLSVSCTSKNPPKKMKQSSLMKFIPNSNSSVLPKSSCSDSDLKQQNKANNMSSNSSKQVQNVANVTISKYFKTSSSDMKTLKKETDSFQQPGLNSVKVEESQTDCGSTTDYDSDETFIGSQSSLISKSYSEDLARKVKEKVDDTANTSKTDKTLNNSTTCVANESHHKHYDDKELSFFEGEETLYSKNSILISDNFKSDKKERTKLKSKIINKSNNFFEESTENLSLKPSFCTNKDEQEHCSQNTLKLNNVKHDNTFTQETLEMNNFIPDSLLSSEFSLQTNKELMHEIAKNPVNYDLNDDYTIKWVEDSEGQLIYDRMTQRKDPGNLQQSLGMSEGFLEFEQGIISRKPDQSTQNKIR